MIEEKHDSFDSLMEGVLIELSGSPMIESRNGKCKEIIGATLCYPALDVLLFLASRKDFYLAKVFETLWVLSGDDSIDRLTKFIPRARDFSDDTYTWNGAYGIRMRGYHATSIREGNDEPDQLEHALETLEKDLQSRQAVISLLRPARDIGTGTKDIPCNNVLQFLVRDGKLNLHVYQRSCDVIWGFTGINAFEWGSLVQYAAHWLKVLPGLVVHHFGSLHLYETHWDKSLNMIDELIGTWEVNETYQYQSELQKYGTEIVNDAKGIMNEMVLDLLLTDCSPGPLEMKIRAAKLCKELHGRVTLPHIKIKRGVLERLFVLWDKLGRQPYTHECLLETCEHLKECQNAKTDKIEKGNSEEDKED